MIPAPPPDTRPYHSSAVGAPQPAGGKTVDSTWQDMDGDSICRLGDEDLPALQAMARRQDHDGLTLLSKMARTGHTEAVRALLNAGAQVNLTTAATGPLKEAILEGRTKVAEILLEAGADIRWKDEEGKNVYHWLARGAEKTSSSELQDILKVLYAREHQSGQASLINEPDSRSNTALEDLISASDRISRDVLLDTAMALYEGGAHPTRTVFKHHIIDIHFLQSLLESGFDPNAQTGDGGTILMQAVNRMQFDLVKLLLDYEAEPLLADRSGSTPLRLALKYFQSALRFLRFMMERYEKALKIGVAKLPAETLANFQKGVSNPASLTVLITPDLSSASFEGKFSAKESFLETRSSDTVLAPLSLQGYINIGRRLGAYRAVLATYHQALRAYDAQVKKVVPAAHLPSSSYAVSAFEDCEYYDKIVKTMVEHAKQYDRSPHTRSTHFM